MKHCCVILLAFLLSLQCAGQKIRFNLVGCTLTKSEKAAIEKVARYELAFYSTIFKIRKIPTIQVSLYGDYEKFYKQPHGSSFPRTKTGFYSYATKTVYVFKDSNFVTTCYHEINHFIFSTQLSHIPTWINEGLSVYFEKAKIDTVGNIEIMPWKYGKSRMKFLIGKNRYNFEWLTKATHKKFHRRRDLDHYVESWALVYFLMSKDKTYVPGIITGLKAGKNSQEAIDDVYKGGMEQLVKDVVAYYR
jgi:hypothetical protein